MPTPNLTNDEIVNSLETCVLCGSRLKFEHQTDYLNLQVHEEARCMECGIKNKVVSFILQ